MQTHTNIHKQTNTYTKCSIRQDKNNQTHRHIHKQTLTPINKQTYKHIFPSTQISPCMVAYSMMNHE